MCGVLLIMKCSAPPQKTFVSGQKEKDAFWRIFGAKEGKNNIFLEESFLRLAGTPRKENGGGSEQKIKLWPFRAGVEDEEGKRAFVILKLFRTSAGRRICHSVKYMRRISPSFSVMPWSCPGGGVGI